MIPAAGVPVLPAAVLPVRAMVASATADVVGRSRDIEVVAAALAAGRSVLLEGPPGTGKTTLLRALASGAGVALELVEGNAELSPTRLVGHHDPSRVLSEGYRSEIWEPGPLTRAMTEGSLLYVEELNRVPEETLNVLLGVLSERRMQVPRLGEVVAAPTFRLVATMNPFDAVGTGRITPALYDRTCRVAVGYQSEDEELAVVRRRAPGGRRLTHRAVAVVRATRDHPELRIGSSVRGAIDLVAVAGALLDLRAGQAATGEAAASETVHDEAEAAAGLLERAGRDAALTALSGRVTVREGSARSAEDIIGEMWAATAGLAYADDDPAAGDGLTDGEGGGDPDDGSAEPGADAGAPAGKAGGPGTVPPRTGHREPAAHRP